MTSVNRKKKEADDVTESPPSEREGGKEGNGQNRWVDRMPPIQSLGLNRNKCAWCVWLSELLVEHAATWRKG